MLNKSKKYYIIFLILSQILFGKNDKGLMNYRNQQFDKARKYYESILQKENSPLASFGLGTSAFQLGDIESAVKAFDDALKSEDDRLKAKSYYNMGNILYSQQRMDESLAFFKKSLEFDPTDNEAKANYEMLKYQMQNQNQNDKENQEDNKDQKKKQENKEQNQSEEEKLENKDSESSENSQEKDQENKNQKDKTDEQSDQQDEKPDGLENEENETKEASEKSLNEEKEKEENKKNAEVILNALKQDDKINQKRKISKAASKKLEKDW